MRTTRRARESEEVGRLEARDFGFLSSRRRFHVAMGIAHTPGLLRANWSRCSYTV